MRFDTVDESEPTTRKRLDGTPQQEAFWAELLDGTGHILLEARAGTGKSTSCREGMWRQLERDPRTVIRYCCFNKKIADEFAERCPPGVEVGTMHRFGLMALDAAFKPTIDKHKTYTVLDGIGAGDLKRYLRKSINNLVSLAKNHGVRPDDPNRALALDEFIDRYDVEVYRQRNLVIDWAMKALAKSAEMTTLVDFDDMLWMPVLHGLSFPSVDFLFIDECQDLNPVQHELAELLSGSGRTIVVGDPYQCQPAGTLVSMTGGERKNIEDVRPGDAIVSFDRHSHAMVGRTKGARRVEKVASRSFSGRLIEVAARDRATLCTPEHKWVTRFIARDSDIWVTYLMHKEGKFRVGWCQLFTSQGGSHLSTRTRIEGADSAWILNVHRNKTDASVDESIIAARYGIPTITFKPVEGATHLTQDAIDRVHSALSMDVHSRAIRCLEDHGRSARHPFYSVDLQQKQGRTTVFTTQACNLLPEIMAVPVWDGDREPVWSAVSIHRREYIGNVYSLQVEGDETYVANGIVTHNSIYAFRGADSDSIPKLRDKLSATVMPLTITFRCPRSHVEVARQLVPDFECAPEAPEGTLIEDDFQAIDDALPGDLVLCRANAPIIKACLHQIARKMPAIVRGRAIGDSLLSVVRAIGDTATIPEFVSGLARWRSKEITRLEAKDGTEDLIEQVEDKAGCLDALASACSSPVEVPGLIQRLFSDEDSASRVTFSSVHRAKGSEARRVTYIQIPYSEKRDRKKPPQQWELDQRRNLRYVAVTRSLDTLTLVS